MRYLLSFAIDSIHQTEILIRRIKKERILNFACFFVPPEPHTSQCVPYASTIQYGEADAMKNA